MEYMKPDLVEKIQKRYIMITSYFKKGIKDGRKYGIAFILTPRFADQVANMEYANERILYVMLKLNAGKVSLI